MGGMGNQMFQYSLARHLAYMNKTEFKMDLAFLLDRKPRKNFVFRNYDLSIFNVKGNFATSEEVSGVIKNGGIYLFKNGSYLVKIFKSARARFAIKTNKKYVNEPSHNFSPEILKLASDVYLEGYWQTEKYFKDIEKIIRSDFTFKKTLSDKGNILAEKIKNTNSIFINIRRADYVNNSKATEFHGVLGLDYYNKAIKYMLGKTENPLFLIFSDDIDWCKDNLKIDHQHIFVGYDYAGEKFSEYLELMSLCKHGIISNSTFAWWAAWLNSNKNKIIIAPKQWFVDSSINAGDICPNDWIRI